MMVRVALGTVLAAALTGGPHAVQAIRGETSPLAFEQGQAASILAPTNHPVLPRDVSRLWFVPADKPAASGSTTQFLAAMKVADKEDFGKALPLLARAADGEGPLADYAAYYEGLAQLRLGRSEEARRTLRQLVAGRPIGYLAEAAALAEAEAAEVLKDYDEAVAIYERLVAIRTTVPEDVLMRLGAAAKSAGDTKKAAEAFGRVLYDFPLSAAAPQAELEYAALPNVQRLTAGSQRYKLELGRAERLFGARRWPEARKIFDSLRPLASGDDRDLVDLRLAECDYYQKKLRPARDGVKPFTAKGSRRAEALYFYALAVGDLGDVGEYQRAVRQIVDEYPTEHWAEEALNHLATRHILNDDDAAADLVFRELYDKYARGSYAERAAWKAGWRAYRQDQPAETVKFFEKAAADFPRSDYRPAWLYWAGRAHDRLEQPALADERYMLAAADYMNSYYGRLALRRLDGRVPPPRVLGEPTSVLPPPPNEPLIRLLLSIERYDEALNEVRYAQRAWGDSPALQATTAYAYRRQGLVETDTTEKFNQLRGSITLMRRAYPQFMAAGGEDLPRDILLHIFPLSYWDLIRKYTAPHGLDPYLIAALMAQESTFVPGIRSHANAYGLLQLVPPTARQMARKLKIAYSSRLLTNPDANVRMGTAHFAELVRDFGSVHLALASYNAGPSPVKRWIAERPGLTDHEEFIDDIPYPETQSYVKRILGTAEDYRRLYGSK
jgi:soluble lytic murein transglycosylase